MKLCLFLLGLLICITLRCSAQNINDFEKRVESASQSALGLKCISVPNLKDLISLVALYDKQLADSILLDSLNWKLRIGAKNNLLFFHNDNFVFYADMINCGDVRNMNCRLRVTSVPVLEKDGISIFCDSIKESHISKRIFSVGKSLVNDTTVLCYDEYLSMQMLLPWVHIWQYSRSQGLRMICDCNIKSNKSFLDRLDSVCDSICMDECIDGIQFNYYNFHDRNDVIDDKLKSFCSLELPLFFMANDENPHQRIPICWDFCGNNNEIGEYQRLGYFMLDEVYVLCERRNWSEKRIFRCKHFSQLTFRTISRLGEEKDRLDLMLPPNQFVFIDKSGVVYLYDGAYIITPYGNIQKADVLRHDNMYYRPGSERQWYQQ